MHISMHVSSMNVSMHVSSMNVSMHVSMHVSWIACAVWNHTELPLEKLPNVSGSRRSHTSNAHF